MAKNKIIYGDETLIDLTSDTVSPSTLLSGETAHDRSGEEIVGTVTVPDELNDLDDVNISSPTGGQALIYDSQNDEWVNGTVSGTDGVDWTSFNYLGAKNLNSTPYYHDSGRTSYGITFTVGDDGIVTANGTVDDGEWAYYRCHSHEYNSNSLILPNGTYILSGCPTNTDSYWIEALVLSSQTEVSLGRDFGDGCTITLTGSDDTPTGYTRLGIAIFLDENVTVTNLQFKPMVRLSSVVDDTWTPYALTNRELTEKIGEASDSNVYQKNTTDDNDYRVLLSHSYNDTNETDYVRKSSELQFNNGEGLTVDTLNTSNVIQSSKVIVGNNIADGVSGATYGKVRLYGQGTYYTDIGDMNGVLTANRELSLPDDSGTLAIKDDIPTKVSDLNNDSGFSSVTANPSTTTETLSGIEIDGTGYALPSYVDWESNSILGAKNLLPLTLDYLKTVNTEGTWNDNVYTLNGITFTVNGGSNVTDITVSGAPITTVYENIFYCTSSYTEGVYFYVPQSARYTLSGCPSGGSAYGGYKMKLQARTPTGITTWGDGDTGEGISGDMLTTYKMQIVIAISYSYDGQTRVFKPMLRLASDTDNTWEPHSMTNQELTRKVEELVPVSANPSTTTETLTSIEIDGIGYDVQGGGAVSGVKGANEQNYRTGNVSISSNDIGALCGIITDGIIKYSMQKQSIDNVSVIFIAFQNFENKMKDPNFEYIPKAKTKMVIEQLDTYPQN